MDYDVIVVGGGPGGYHAASLVGKGGKKTLLIERAQLGGTCLNAGCIPTKALLHTAKLYHEAQTADVFGVEVGAPSLNWSRAQARKQQVIEQLRGGVRALLARGQVEVIAGEASITDRQTVSVNGQRYRAHTLILALGATPHLPPALQGTRALTTTQLLEIESNPASLVIVGGHPISLGIASIFGLTGTQVSIVEAGTHVAPMLDSEIREMLLPALPNVKIYTNASISAVTDDAVHIAQNGEHHTLPAAAIVANTERRPNIQALSALDLDIVNGGVRVDGFMRTNLPNIYAIGDLTGQAMWAHVALSEAEIASAHLLGKSPAPMQYAHVPVPVYTLPEVAYVGLTEAEARAAGHRVRVARLPLTANGRFVVDTPHGRGLCKVIIDDTTQRLLGVHLLGGNAADMIYGVAAMLADEFRVQDVQALTFAHPTVSEVLKDTLML